jgi:hypothetical protein
MAQVHGFVTGRGGLGTAGLFEQIGHRNGARTRLVAGVNNLELPAARTEIRRNFFTVRTVQGWNSLPDQIKQCGNSKQFKTALKSHVNGGRS